MIDYKELLKKYIDHVGICEGSYFIYEDMDDHYDFTKEEVHILNDLSDEINEEYVKRHD